MSGTDERLPEWERLLSAAARLQLPGVTLAAGGTSDLRDRFAVALRQLEAASGWKAAGARSPGPVPGSLDGIETDVRQLIRSEPLETTVIEHRGTPITIPTDAEILRIKAVLILKRNATRDYLDFAALAQLSNAQPGDLTTAGTGIYRNPALELRDWNRVSDTCPMIAQSLFEGLSEPPPAG